MAAGNSDFDVAVGRRAVAFGSTAFITETVSQLADLAWDVASAPVSPESRQQVFDRADAIATLFGNPGLIVDHYRDTYTQADALERQGRIRDAETLRAQATLDLLSMVAGGAGLAKTAVATLPRVAELAKLAAAGGKSTAGAGIASVTADAKAVLPAGYSELKSAGSAANTTGGLPDGHRRVVAPDGDIVILAPDGKVYASIDEIPSGGAGSSAGGGVNGTGSTDTRAPIDRNFVVDNNLKLLPHSPSTKFFKGDEAVQHFKKHASELMDTFGRDSYNLKSYLGRKLIKFLGEGALL